MRPEEQPVFRWRQGRCSQFRRFDVGWTSFQLSIASDVSHRFYLQNSIGFTLALDKFCGIVNQKVFWDEDTLPVAPRKIGLER